VNEMKVEFSHNEMRHIPGRVLMDAMSKIKEIEEQLNVQVKARK